MLTMKSLIHFILFFTLCAHYFVSTSGDAVLDGDGNEVELGSTYYIFPATDPRRGGIALGSTGAQRCGQTVIQQKVNVENGIPVSFHPSDPKAKVVDVSANVNIKFDSKVPWCAKSTVWSAGGEFIEINGELGNLSCKNAGSWFHIETGKSKNSYKLGFNPSGVCPDIIIKDATVGVTVSEEGLRPLTLRTGTPYEVKFWKHNNVLQAVA